MSYSQVVYVVFFLGVAFSCYTIAPKKFKSAVLLIFSYLFFFISSKKYIIFLFATTLSVYLGGLVLNKIDDGFKLGKKGLERSEKKELKQIINWQKKAVVVTIILFNFGILALLKYFNFFTGICNDILGVMHIPMEFEARKFMMPLGISYYTLQASSYILDVYRGKYRADKSLPKVALFIAFFPQIIEGPIGRFDLLADQLYEGHKFDYKKFTFGIQLIFWGLLKKVVIADRANAFVCTIFGSYQKYTGPVVVLAMLLYTLQIYAEFSGCMDIVTGSAQLFGVQLSQNFNQPFASKSVSEFWRRWHMTLGSWFRDYVFYSVSLSKTFVKFSKKAREKMKPFFASLIPAALAMFVVWFGTGIWHGASWKYVMYGLYYYIIMVIGMFGEPLFSKFFEKTHINRKGKVFGAFQVFRTFIFINVGMLLFNASSLKTFGEMFVSMFKGWSLAPFVSGDIFTLGCDSADFAVLLGGAILLLIVGVIKEKGHDIRTMVASRNIVLRWVLYYALIFAVIILGAYGKHYGIVAFIYAQF